MRSDTQRERVQRWEERRWRRKLPLTGSARCSERRRVGDARQSAVEDSVVAVDRGAVEDLEGDLDVGRAEEPEPAGVAGQLAWLLRTGKGCRYLTRVTFPGVIQTGARFQGRPRMEVVLPRRFMRPNVSRDQFRFEAHVEWGADGPDEHRELVLRLTAPRARAYILVTFPRYAPPTPASLI